MEHRAPSPAVTAAHAEASRTLPFDDTADFADADRGFLGRLTPGVVRGADGSVVWDGDAYDFLEGPAPTSVHPSLWRQSVLCAKQGLYEVVPDAVYQVRGLDLSNVTFLEGEDGVLVVDPLISTETAAAALSLYRRHRGPRPVTAVIYTHSHVDHFGGVLGVTTAADVAAGRVAVVAPEGFVEHAVAENVYAGTAMARRAAYMYGAVLRRGPRGQVGTGLGQTTSTGEVALLAPTVSITATGQRLVLDGVEIEFQLAPDSEAPAEMHFFLPGCAALCIAENATHTLHNLGTLRGALVRDARAWAGHLTAAIDRYAERSDVVFASHHWPIWGRERVADYLGAQRDLYAYLHDQTLRLINRGLTGAEIAEQLELPPALRRAWHARGYYGSVEHDVKAVYQRYLGWFDGNPARLWPHPPEALGRRYVAAIGGVDRVVDVAREAFERGDFRWSATLLDHAVFTDADHGPARELYADTLEQLAYGAENATWRNFYLSGATELRTGGFGTPGRGGSAAMLAHLGPDQVLDLLAISVNGPAAWDLRIALDVTFADTGVNHRVVLRNGVLVHRERTADPAAVDATVTVAGVAGLLIALAGGLATPDLVVSGDPTALPRLLAVLDAPDPGFAIVTP